VKQSQDYVFLPITSILRESIAVGVRNIGRQTVPT